MTTRKVVTPSMRDSTRPGRRHVWHVAGIDCRFLTVREDRFFGIEQTWIGERFRVRITDRERTVLDLFAQPRHFGGIGEGLSVLERALDSIDVTKLVAYAVRYRSTTLAKRLGWALEHAGAEPGAIMPLLELPSSSYGLLDPGRPRRGVYDRRWKLIDNLSSASSRA